MAAGSREKYALDLNDIFAFPDGENVPLRPPNTAAGESWVMLLEVDKGLPSFQTEICGGDITGKWFTVMINTSNPSLDTADYESGYTLCILNAEPLFGPNYINYEVNDISTVELLPVPLAKLWELNDRLRTRSDAGDLLKCLSCGNAGELCCSVCKSQYCSTECQRADWPEHKLECKALGVLRRYNETDWG
ncbi:hypothetical protein BGY98DRAFT_991871 [Russula aff. rugulosa BPL654]|nr:hypothetical protein BGY98DRAFT_991871 [Russula aff. rugulosa BPL654]